MSSNDITQESFFTPEEIAERLKLSTATVYKLISQDKLPYFRVGKCYRIPAQAFRAYMMKEGNLAQFIGRVPTVPEAAKFFIEKLGEAAEDVRSTIRAVILFGSYARGDWNEDSDIDLLVLLSKNSSEVEREISILSSEAMSCVGFEQLLSPIRMSIGHWIELAGNGSPFYERIQEEGIPLWPKGLKSLEHIESVPGKN